jgi:hypothetical protein
MCLDCELRGLNDAGFAWAPHAANFGYQAECGRGSSGAVASGTKCRVGYNNMFRRPI